MRVLASLVVLLAATRSFGASTTVMYGKQVIYLHTGTNGGGCATRTVQDGVEETVCRDGGELAAASTSAGCLDSTGTGYCAVGRRHTPGAAGSQLTCGAGSFYVLYVGPEADCRIRDGSKVCRSPDGASTAVASCETGCELTTGNGGCCYEPGCPWTTKSNR